MKTFSKWLEESQPEFLTEVRRDTMQGSEWRSPVDWAVVEDHINNNTCNTMRRYGDCHHRKCQEGIELAELAHRADMGERLSEHEIERIISFIRSKTCSVHRSGRTCSHFACGYTVHLIEWLEDQQRKGGREIA